MLDARYDRSGAPYLSGGWVTETVERALKEMAPRLLAERTRIAAATGIPADQIRFSLSTKLSGDSLVLTATPRIENRGVVDEVKLWA